MGTGIDIKGLLAEESLCKLLVVAAALTWGYSFFVMKDVVGQFPVFWLLAVRFCSSAALMAVIFRRHVAAGLDRATIGCGVFLGLLGWAGYALQTVGITLTTPGKNAFLTGTYCVIVPFCAWLIGLGRPERYNVVGALLCLVGLGFVALDDGLAVNAGDALTLAGATFYALQMAEVSKRGPSLDVWSVTMWELLTMGAASLVCAAALGQAPDAAAFTPGNVGALVFLALACSLACTVALNHALTVVDPTAGALLASLESPSGVLFSVAYGAERLTSRLVVGFILIFCAIVFSEAGPTIVAALPSVGRRRRP